VKWYRLAAEQGYALAQNNLGFMYAKGQAVPQDHVLAHMLFDLAASRLEAEERDMAIKNRDIVASKMTPEQIAEAQKLAREWKPK
jgi:TPR repeat protein